MNGVDELDDDAHRHDAELGGRALARRRVRPVHHRRRTRRSAAAVVVLGPDTATRAVRRRAIPVGQTVSYNGVKLEVIGVLEPLSSSENDVEQRPRGRAALAPTRQRLVGGTNRNSVSSIYVKATLGGDAVGRVPGSRRAPAQRPQHHQRDANADFSIATQQSILSAATSVDDTLTVMLGGIAVIALLVGGIGVMNIMLVSVTERIREIGLRKAIGARPASIRRQFLVEASILGLAGGMLGVGARASSARCVIPRSATRA